MRQHNEISRGVPSPAVVAEALAQQRQHSLRRIDTFPRAWRPAILELAQHSPALQDLADSFPALLFALATGFGTEDGRRAALAAVTAGLPLREAAARLGLPFWLRKLPAAAFNAPLMSPPSDPSQVTRLMSLIPTQAGNTAAWLERVLVANHTGRPDLALWVAQQYRGPLPSARSISFLGVLAWAWFAGTRADHRASQLLQSRWTQALGARRAAGDARLWRDRLALDVCLGTGLTDSWLAEATVGDLDFVALRTADDFIAEAVAMDNCLDRYTDRLEGRTVRVFSIRRDGRSIADLEIATHEREPGHPVIAQLRGPHNRRAPLEVWQAAYAWLGGQPLRLADKHLEVKVGRATRLRRQGEIWQPFLDAVPPHVRAPLSAALFGKPGHAKSTRAVRTTRSVPVS